MPATNTRNKERNEVPTAAPTAGVEGLWGKRETAKYLGFKVTSLDNWGRAGYGPQRLRIGGKILYDPDQVREWAKAQAVSNECTNDNRLAERAIGRERDYETPRLRAR